MTERKPDGQRVRRNKGDLLPWVDLPAEGRAEWPDPPEGVGEHGRAWWAKMWATPTATQWTVEDEPAAHRRAQLEDLWQAGRDPKLLTEMRHLETALGLTAKARKELRWRIVDDGEVVEENGKMLSAAERRKRMRAV